jgi:hypothetical protein
MAWDKVPTTPSGSKMSVNPVTKSLSVNDERIRDLFLGNAFAFLNTYSLKKNNSKHFLIVRPGPVYRVILAIYAAATGPCTIDGYGAVTIDDYGDLVTDPAPFNRNSDPQFYREPYVQIYEGGEYSGGIHTFKERIDWNLRAVPDSFYDRAIIAWTNMPGSAGIHIKAGKDEDVDFNFIVSWQEHEII